MWFSTRMKNYHIKSDFINLKNVAISFEKVSCGLIQSKTLKYQNMTISKNYYL